MSEPATMYVIADDDSMVPLRDGDIREIIEDLGLRRLWLGHHVGLIPTYRIRVADQRILICGLVPNSWILHEDEG